MGYPRAGGEHDDALKLVIVRSPARHGQNERAFCVGRCNWLFADTVAGANASARLYSLIECAKT